MTPKKPTHMHWLACCALLPALATGADLLAYYDFDDPSDPTNVPAADGISPAAAINAPASFSADAGGRSGANGDYALDFGTFPGSGGYARVPAGSHLDLAETLNAMSVSFWQFNSGDGVGGFHASSAFWIDSPSAAADGRGFQAHTPWSDQTLYFDQSGCCGPTQRLTAAGAIQANVWQHIVVQRDENGNQEIWVNGLLVANSAGAEALDAFSGIVTIGANGGGNNNFTGLLDEFAIYAGTLSQAEIVQLADGTARPSDIATPPDDADDDGLPDAWETAFGLSPNDDGSVDINNGPAGDPDSDGLTNQEEFDAGLEPNNDDFDNDGLLDGVESNTGIYVSASDTGTDPQNPDSDGDGLSDGVEVPTEPFVDVNQPGTDPNNRDSDGDTFDDLIEINLGNDPTDSQDAPGSEGLTLLAYYNFDGQSLDQTGNAPEAVLGGPAFLTTGGMGTTGVAGDEALELGTVNDGSHAQTAPGNHLDQAFVNNAMSVSFWQFRTQDGSTSSFWIHSPSAGANQRGFQAHTPWSDGTIYFDQSGCCGPTQRLTTTGSTINTWEHYVFQRDSDGNREIWINGILAATAADGEPLDPFDGVITIGSEGPNLANSFGGRIDDFAIFSDVLTSEQISELASGVNPPELFGPSTPFEITAFSYDPGTGATVITWNSRPNRTYALEVSDDLGGDSNAWAEIEDNIPSQGEQTVYNAPSNLAGPRKFFRIREVN